jgi:hypothetical protein
VSQALPKARVKPTTQRFRDCVVAARKEITRVSTGGLNKRKRRRLILKRAIKLYRKADC